MLPYRIHLTYLTKFRRSLLFILLSKTQKCSFFVPHMIDDIFYDVLFLILCIHTRYPKSCHAMIYKKKIQFLLQFPNNSYYSFILKIHGKLHKHLNLEIYPCFYLNFNYLLSRKFFVVKYVWHLKMFIVKLIGL